MSATTTFPKTPTALATTSPHRTRSARRSAVLGTLPLLAAVLVLVGRSAVLGAGPVDFNRDIRPILSDKCFRCHGPDEKQRQSGLRLDLRDAALAKADSGAAAIVSGKPDESALIARIHASDPAERMPPAATKKSLSATERDLLRRWIAEGASYRAHWAFATPVRPPLPAVRDAAWPKNEIDRFVLARMEAEGLQPSPEADRRTLIRRVTFDLTGLPPTPAEVEAFVGDAGPDAYEKVVDRLLASEHYGEHRARFWLDAARYGDTHGLHLDNYREMWPYRDWVIRAFAANMPFDRFVTEQLAGDLLESPTLDQLVATGFNRCHVTTNEGGSIAEEVYVRNVVDRVETTGTVFLGMTVGCAVCHDHKFDPFTMKDFYSLFAFFNSLDGNEMDGNRKDPAPVVEVPSAAARTARERLDAELADVGRRLAERAQAAEQEFAAWDKEATAAVLLGEGAPQTAPPTGAIAHLAFDDAPGTSVADAADPQRKGTVRGKPGWTPGRLGQGYRFADPGSYVEIAGNVAAFDRTQPYSVACWVRTPGNVNGAVVSRMDDAQKNRGWDVFVIGRKVAMHLIDAWPASALKVSTQADVLKPDAWHHVCVVHDGSGKSGGVRILVDGIVQPFGIDVDTLKGTTVSKAPLLVGRRHPGSPFAGGAVDDLRIYDRALANDEVAALTGADPVREILALEPAKRTAAQRDRLRDHFLAKHDPAWRKLADERAAVEKRIDALKKDVATTLVFRETKTPKPAFVLKRGQYDQKGDAVGRATPAFLPPLAEGLPRNRLGLAKWLLDPQQPLTGRVAVNRFWQQCFGAGLVRTSEDFGSQGDWPSHPELLDWLAVDFRESGWDVKGFFRRIVTSATYRQSSRVRPELLAKDPQNRLLARGPRYRLDAEMVRDQALSLGGLLVETVGGPSVKPPQPAGLWEAVGYTSSNTARFAPDTGHEKVHRRSLYTFWKRTSPPPQMNMFDAPSREACTVRRERTNTPLQALLLMNDPQFVEAARAFADRTLAGNGTAEQRLDAMFRRATGRPPVPAELSVLAAALDDLRAKYAADPEAAARLVASGQSPPGAVGDAPERAAWTMIANLILNLDEVLNKN